MSTFRRDGNTTDNAADAAQAAKAAKAAGAADTAGAGSIPRRRLLIGTAAATLLATAASWARLPTAAWADDDFETLRARWQDLLAGSGFDPTAAPYAKALTALGQQAAGYRGSLTPTAGSLWPDLPLGTVSNHITQSYVRLKTLALAYVQPGTGLTGDAALAAQIADGLDHVRATAYGDGTATYDNWWDWQIGAPESLLDTCVLMAGQLSSAQLDGYCAAVDHFVPDSAVAVYSGTSTGANRVDLCRVIALRGVVGKNSAKIATAAGALSPVFPYVTTGDGLYADGSFIQHTVIPYTASYGEVMLGGLSRLFALLAASPWAVTDPLRSNVTDSVVRSFAPFVFNGLAMDNVSGRAISRGLQGTNPTPQSEATRGHALLSDILRLADSGLGSAEQSADWKAMVKGWMRRETFLPYMTDPGIAIPELARAQALSADTTVPAAAEPVGHRIFGMGRSVHRRPGWAAAVSVCSSRTTYYENGNGENLRGWHTNNGMLAWWGAAYGNDQYSDAFWPTVDPYRLPGTTVSTVPLADGAGGAWGAPHPDAAFAGGASDGTYAVVGQDVRGLNSTLTAKKSWFFLDDAVVCLGAGISATDGVPIQTTVDNRNLGAAGTHALTVDGLRQPQSPGWSRQFTRAGTMAIAGFGAYVFPRGAAVHALRESRTGSWHDINILSSTQQLTRTYLTLWLDHGTDPAGADYFYVLMPGADTRAALRRPQPRVLANTAAVQAIEDRATGVVAANFFAPGRVGPITADAPCSVLLRPSRGTLTVAVSDPAQSSAAVGVTVDLATRAVVSHDPELTITRRQRRFALSADVAGAYGASRTAVLRQG